MTTDTQDSEPCKRLARLARLLYERDLTELCGGNISFRANGNTYVTPTYAAEYFQWRLRPEDIVILGNKGSLVQGVKEHLSREMDLHLRIYEACTGVHSVFHLHTPVLVATADQWSLAADDVSVRNFLHEQRVSIRILPQDLVGQTTAHDDAVLACLAEMDEAGVRIVVGPRHGLFSAAPDAASHFRAIDGLASRLNSMFLRFEMERIRQ